jgi:hypothetical protein
MKPDPEPLIAIAEAQHKAYKRATRRLQHRQRLEPKSEKISLSAQAPWLEAVRRDDATDPVLVSGEIPQLEEEVAA